MMALWQLIKSMSGGYMISQAALITFLFVCGSFLVFASGMWREENKIWALLYAFPAGLAVFAVSGYLMLCIGIPYNTFSVVFVLVLVDVVCAAVLVKNGGVVNIIFNRKQIFTVFACVIAVFIIGVMLTANIFDVAIDNDSLYYFSAYPDAIVQEGRYTKYFDVFLTDAAPIGSIVQTLPYLFGFNETFGVQYFLDLNFLLIFLCALTAELEKTLGRKGALCCSAVTVVFLITSSAYLTTAKWIMAGVYFMSYYFMTAYLGYMSAGERERPGARPYVLMAVMMVMTAMLRHEGVMLTTLLILTLSALDGYRGIELASACVFPVFFGALLYYTRVFVILAVHPLYAFLTPAKAAVMVLSLVFTAVYLLFLRDRLTPALRRSVLILLPLGALLLNILIMIIRSDRYIGNLKMFYLNVRIGAGWGYFGYIAFVVMAALLIRAVIKKEWYLSFFDSLMLSYVLGVFIVSFGRGDSLRKGVGDSGNRVMLTAVPLIVFAVSLRILEAVKDGTEGETGA